MTNAADNSNLVEIVFSTVCGCWEHTGGSCWPRTEIQDSIVEGELAARVRTRVGATPDARVTLRETAHVAGYSEYTQDTDYEFEVRCWGETFKFAPTHGWNALVSLLNWLDEDANTVEQERNSGTDTRETAD